LGQVVREFEIQDDAKRYKWFSLIKGKAVPVRVLKAYWGVDV
jgi:hypothetical protein